MAEQLCPLCGRDVKLARVSGRDASQVDCPQCGRFVATGSLMSSMGDDADKTLLPYLSARTRQANTQGPVVELTPDNWRDFARSHQRTPVSRKLLAILEHIAGRSRWPGDRVELNYQNSAPLFDAASADE